MKNFLNLIGIAAIIIALSIGYYFIIYLPQKDQAELAIQKQIQLDKSSLQQQEQIELAAQKEKQKSDLQKCLLEADIDGNNFWNDNCKNFGIDKKTEGCLLPKDTAERVEKSTTDAKNVCFKIYPQN